MNKIVVAFIGLLFLQVSCSTSEELRGWDVDLFKSTEVYDLVLDLEDGDTSEIREFVAHGGDINVQEPHFGFTLLHWSTFRNDLSSCVSLLNNGANPNVFDHKKMTPLFYSTYPSCSFEILKVLVDNGSLPNLESNAPHYLTPLMGAASSSLEKTKYLVQNNANVRFYKIDVDYRQDTTITDALSCSLLMNQLEIAEYLIIQCDADYEKIWNVSWEGYIWDICGYLEDYEPKYQSDDWYAKQRILAFLKSRGLDCQKTMVERKQKDSKKTKILQD